MIHDKVMRKNSLSGIFRTLGLAFSRCAHRFPVTLAFALLLTFYLCYLVYRQGGADDRKLLVCIGYFLSVGTVLSLSLHLWAEEVKSRKLRLGMQIVAPVLLAVDAFFLYCNIEGTRAVEVGIAHGAAIFAIGLSLFFLSFFREKNDIPAWNFAQTAIGTLALTLIVGAVMSGGLCLLALSLHQLFGIEVSYKCYLSILILCSELLPLLMFLGLLPEGEHKHDRQPQPTAFLRGTIRYLFLPLAGLYLLVLYVYAGTIIVRWELPDGWVSWLVVALMAGVIAIEVGLYPSRIKEGRRADERIARWLPVLTLPLLVLMTVGIGRRFLDYGITINRLYLVTLNAWFYFLCIGLIVGRARRLSWIPISFSLVFLLTSVLPVNYASITLRVLRSEVREALAQGGYHELPLSAEAYGDWLLSLPRDEARRINGKVVYLSDWYGEECTADIVPAGTTYLYETQAVVTELETENLHYTTSSNYTLPLSKEEFRYFSIVQSDSRVQPDSLLVAPLGIGTDSVDLSLDSLRHWSRRIEDVPHMFRTRQGNRLILTRCSLFGLSPKNAGGAELHIDGYLFHNIESTTKE